MADNVSANLDKFIKDLDSVYLKKAMTNACAKVQTEAVKRCPKDTGNLRRSIDFQVDPSGIEGAIYSNAEYAPYVEVGTGIHSTKGTGRQKPWTYKSAHGFFRTSGNKAQPFLEPAAQSSLTQIRECFEGLI